MSRRICSVRCFLVILVLASSIGGIHGQQIEEAPTRLMPGAVATPPASQRMPSTLSSGRGDAGATTAAGAGEGKKVEPSRDAAASRISIPAETKPDPRSPEQVAADFFASLQADKVDAAYEGLSAGATLRTRGEESLELRARTQGAIDAYGPIKGFELVKTERVGKMLERRTYVLHGEVLPLRWRFYFYRGSGSWQLVDLRVDDALVELFDEAGVTENP